MRAGRARDRGIPGDQLSSLFIIHELPLGRPWGCRHSTPDTKDQEHGKMDASRAKAKGAKA